MFTETQTRPLLGQVCRDLGLSGSQARLLRHHTNAVYAVDDAVVKIAPLGVATDDLRPVVALVEWLVARGFPTVELYPGVDQPFEIGGHAVTVWQRLDAGDADPVTVVELGALLRELHALAAPPPGVCSLEPLAGIRHSIKASTILADGDRILLDGHLDHLSKVWASMRFRLPPGLIHVDPQSRNALRRMDGQAVLADWDGAAIGPREWDLATIAVHCRRFLPDGHRVFTGFAEAYGWDPATWDGFEDLCRLRELKMIATNARKSRLGSPAAHEVQQRLAALRDGDARDARWQII